jgi:hypothetical protein
VTEAQAVALFLVFVAEALCLAWATLQTPRRDR